MITPHLALESSATPSADRAWRRLAFDLENLELAEIEAPGTLRAKVLGRIEVEPARVETDREGNIQAINPAFTALCGYTFAEVRGRKPGSILQGADSALEAVATMRRAICSGSRCKVDLVNYHKDGSTYYVNIDLEPIVAESGDVTGFRAVERKIS